MNQPHRLGTSLPAEFAAPLIDRSRPIRFSVDGIALDAFEGDTVLSALLANGIISTGTQAGAAVALDAESAPPIVIEGSSGEMPMALCPAIDGLKIRTIGPRKKVAPIKRVLARQRTSLDLDAQLPPGGWIDAEPDETIGVDFAIVGGGVAGMSAALAAVSKGSRVALVEREPILGGIAAFFGKADGETPPEEVIANLKGQIGQRPEITVLTRAEAFEMRTGTLRVVQVVSEGDRVRPRNLAIRFTHAVLATGTEERLPVFPGNRLPGVMGAISAWRMARQFGVWIGNTFHLHSATNAGYRMAMLGSEAGKSVCRASDPRLDPRTRFIEFCKAYGFRLGWDARIAAALPDREGLTIRLAGHQFGGLQNEVIAANALIVAGGWQPALSLWLMAGGSLVWDAERHQLVPSGHVSRVVLAGSVAGWSGTKACAQSGKAAIATLKGAETRVIEDPQIAEIYESRDGGLSVERPAERGLPPAWTGPSRRLAMAEPALSGIAAFVLRQPSERPAAIRWAHLLDVAGAIIAGLLPPAQAAEYCRQWCIVPRSFKPVDLPVPIAPLSPDLPGYLVGRFGLGQAKWRLMPADARAFDPGCMIFINTDETHPRAAIGAIISDDGKGCTALIARTEFGEGDIVYIRDGKACIPARLDRKL